MAKKIGYTILVILATLGVLFIVLMLIPLDEDDEASDADTVQERIEEVTAEETEEAEEEPEVRFGEEYPEETEEEAPAAEPADETDDKEEGENAVVSIPSSEISDAQLHFSAATLENDRVTEDIFSDSDLTLVVIWGTYCDTCIDNMDEYAGLYRRLPDNVNMIGIIVDVYDGIDTNVSLAENILSEAGADFVNLRSGDDLFGLLSQIQINPSYFFVDSEGHVVGDLLEGVRFPEVENRLDSYLE